MKIQDVLGKGCVLVAFKLDTKSDVLIVHKTQIFVNTFVTTFQEIFSMHVIWILAYFWGKHSCK